MRVASEFAPRLAGGRVAVTTTLSSPQRARKETALRCYAGEMPKLERIFRPFLNADRLAYELFWHIADLGAETLSPRSGSID
jgi:hypothetical protein